MANLTDLGAGTFNLSASAAAITGTLTSTGGSVTLGDGGEVAGNVDMNSAGALHMGTAGTVGGTVSTATLDYELRRGGDLQAGWPGGKHGDHGDELRGDDDHGQRQQRQTISGTNATYSLTSANAAIAADRAGPRSRRWRTLARARSRLRTRRTR